MSATLPSVTDALLRGKARSAPERASGCARVYVIIVDKSARRVVKTACAALGMRYLRDAYGTAGHAIYVGYDNCSGLELARGTSIVNELRAVGVACYRDEVGD